MLTYSRNALFSLRNWYKPLKVSTQSHGSLVRPLSNAVWQRLTSYNLLAPTRGQRGGNHLKAHRPIKTVQSHDRRRNFPIQKGPNHSNLLSIQIKTGGITCVTTKTNDRRKSNSGSKLSVAHLNLRSLKNRNHLVQIRELM